MKKGFWFCRLQPILEIALVKLAVSKWSGKLYSVLFPQTTKTKKNLKSRDEPKWSSSSSQSIFLEVCMYAVSYMVTFLIVVFLGIAIYSRKVLRNTRVLRNFYVYFRTIPWTKMKWDSILPPLPPWVLQLQCASIIGSEFVKDSDIRRITFVLGN